VCHRSVSARQVLVDAAAFVPTHPLDLSAHKPDYVAVSFYKMFGYPTGVGALLVRTDTSDAMQKVWQSHVVGAWLLGGMVYCHPTGGRIVPVWVHEGAGCMHGSVGVCVRMRACVCVRAQLTSNCQLCAAESVCHQVYWGGGSVAMATAGVDFREFKCRQCEMWGNAERFEDGTPPFLSIIELRGGLDMLEV
jgi:Aminotransferase class-V